MGVAQAVTRRAQSSAESHILRLRHRYLALCPRVTVRSLTDDFNTDPQFDLLTAPVHSSTFSVLSNCGDCEERGVTVVLPGQTKKHQPGRGPMTALRGPGAPSTAALNSVYAWNVRG